MSNTEVLSFPIKKDYYGELAAKKPVYHLPILEWKNLNIFSLHGSCLVLANILQLQRGFQKVVVFTSIEV